MLQSALGDNAGVVLSAGDAAAMTQSAIKTLGEIALRVNDLPRMKRFYAETLGLRVLGESSTAVFFAVAPGHAGHTQVLVLFARGIEVSAERSTVDHIAFTIDLEGYDSERQRLTALGLSVEVAQHDWVKWRSLYVHDPEGNEVELVCFDPSL
jgi:catechol-2,3-dioxygenase